MCQTSDGTATKALEEKQTPPKICFDINSKKLLTQGSGSTRWRSDCLLFDVAVAVAGAYGVHRVIGPRLNPGRKVLNITSDVTCGYRMECSDTNKKNYRIH